MTTDSANTIDAEDSCPAGAALDSSEFRETAKTLFLFMRAHGIERMELTRENMRLTATVYVEESE